MVLFEISHWCANITNSQSKQWIIYCYHWIPLSSVFKDLTTIKLTISKINLTLELKMILNDLSVTTGPLFWAKPIVMEVRNWRSVFLLTLDLCLWHVRRKLPWLRWERAKEALRNEEWDTDTGKFLCPSLEGLQASFPRQGTCLCADTILKRSRYCKSEFTKHSWNRNMKQS